MAETRGDRPPVQGANGRVLIVGGLALAAAVLALTGLTWAGPTPGAEPVAAPGTLSSEPSESPAPVAVPSTPPGTCHLVVAGEARPMDADRARMLTLVAAVGQQVRAPASATARALDVARADAGKSTPKVTDVLGLFAREDTAEPSAASLAEVDALAAPGALTCAFTERRVKNQKKDDGGHDDLTPRADMLRDGALDAFGDLAMTGFGGKGRPESPAQAAGRALTVRFGDEATDQAEGWVFAHWLVARGDSFALHTVAFDDRTWQPDRGWRAAPADAAPHVDRVYVSVAKGD